MPKLPLPDLLAAIVEVRRMCMFDPSMLPVVRDGMAYGANVDTVPAPVRGLSVEDFVLGYLALGWHHVPILDGAFGTAICIDYSPLPSRWRDRAIALHQAFGPDLGPLRDYLRSTNLGLLLAELDETPAIRRFGTPRRSALAYALMPEVQRGRFTFAELRDRALFAEPTASDQEINEAAALAFSYLADERQEARS